MVDYITRVIISLKDIDQVRTQLIATAPTPEDIFAYGKTIAATTARMADMMEVLAAAGFVFSAKKDYIYADSEIVEAAAVRSLLAERGFADREYQIYLEYRRQWGVM